jgi:hypothetical protein
MTKSSSKNTGIDTSGMMYDPMTPNKIVEKYPQLSKFKNLSEPYTDKIFRYICFLYDPKSPFFSLLIGERKVMAMEVLGIKDVGLEISSNQLEEVRWCASLFFTITNNPIIEIYVSLDEAFSNLLEKARTKPLELDESQEKVAYEGIAKAADNAFEMYGKLKLIREEFNKDYGDIDILDIVKKGEKAAKFETVINFAEQRAAKKAEESKGKK